MDDIELARHLARGAARILMELRSGGTREGPSLDGKALGAEGDARANTWLMAEIAAHRPEDGVLSEERARIRPRGSPNRASGSSTRWMARANMGRDDPIGLSMWRWRLMAHPLWAQWPCPLWILRSLPDNP